MANFLLGRPLAELYLGPDLVGRYKGTSPEWAAASLDPLTLSPSWWLDAMDESSFSLIDQSDSGGGVDRVKQWRDKSGNGKHASVGGQSIAKRPRRLTSDPIANGKPSVSAVDAGSVLPTSTINVDESTTAVAVTFTEIFMVTAAMTGVETQFTTANLWGTAGGSDGYAALFGGPGANGDPRMMGNLNSAIFIGSSNFQTNALKNGSATAIGDATARPLLPLPLAVLRMANTTKTTNIQRTLFNQSVNSMRAWKGPICEVLAFTTPLAAEDKVKVNAYLMKKWGIAV